MTLSGASFMNSVTERTQRLSIVLAIFIGVGCAGSTSENFDTGVQYEIESLSPENAETLVGVNNLRNNQTKKAEETGPSTSRINELIGALRSSDSQAKENSARELSQLSLIPSTSIDGLLLALKNSNKYTRIYSLIALTNSTVERADLSNLLLESTKDADWIVRYSAIELIGRKGFTENLPFLIKVAKDIEEDNSVRRSAISAIGDLGDYARSAGQELVGIYESKNKIGDSDYSPPRHIRVEILKTLGKIGEIELQKKKIAESYYDYDDLSYIEEENENPYLTLEAQVKELLKFKFSNFLYNKDQPEITDLVKIGAPAVPFLADFIKENSRSYFAPLTQAIVALGEIGPSAKSAIPTINQYALENKPVGMDGSRSDVIIEAVEKIDPGSLSRPGIVIHIVGQLGWAYSNDEAAAQLIQIGKPVLPYVFQYEVNTQPWGTIDIFRAIGKPSEQFLLDRLNAPSDRHRQVALKILSDIAPHRAVDYLSNAIIDSNPDVALEAVISLLRMGPKASNARTGLIRVILQNNKNSNKDYKYGFLESFSNSENNLGKRIVIFPNKGILLAENAVRALEKLGPLDEEAIAALVSVAGSNRVAVDALTRVGDFDSSSLVQILIENLRSDVDLLREEAARHLSGMGSLAKPAMIGLILAAGDKNPFVMEQVIRAIHKIGLGNIDEIWLLALSVGLEWIINSDGNFSKERLEKIIGVSVGGDARYINALGSAFSNALYEAKLVAVYLVGKFGPSANKFVNSLKTIVNMEKGSLRNIAIQTLGKIGPEARAALPQLKKIMQDETENMITRKLSIIAIQRILEYPIESEGFIELKIKM